MRSGLKIARISGFDVRVHWSTLVIFSLIVLGLATEQLPLAAGGYSDGAYWGAALTTGVVFYLSLLAHEVSHAVIARREGIEVESLTLWMLGGVATLTGEPRSPRADFQIAGVGPAISLVLAVAFGAAAALAGDGLVPATLAWLGGINLVLALFNLVPAAPLDGGRILRAAIWHFRGDRTEAAIAATAAGEGFGYLLVGLGLVRLLIGAWTGSVWLIILGWFLLNAARAERAQVSVRSALAGMRVRDVMTPRPVTAPHDVTVATLLDDYVMRSRHSAFPVVDGAGRVAGLVTLSQVRDIDPGDRPWVRVTEIACDLSTVPTAGPDDGVLDVVSAANRCGDGRVLVLDDDRLVGIVTPTDVARALDFGDAVDPVGQARSRV